MRCRRSKASGAALMEVVVALAVLGVALLIMAGIGREMRRIERETSRLLFLHPETSAVMARLRADVFEAAGFPQSVADMSQTGGTLLLTVPREGPGHQVVWDFRERGTARRRVFQGTTEVRQWLARGTPGWSVEFEMVRGAAAVRLRGKDSRNALVVDRLFTRRTN